MVSRKYTPISWIQDEGKFDLLIKVYFKNVHPNFPEGGKLSQYLNSLEMGKSIKCKGPIGKLKYLGDGDFEIITKLDPITTVLKHYDTLFMIAGGTGITPIYQIIQSIALNNDKTKVILIFGNKSTNDFLLKEELDEFVSSKKIDLNVIYTIDKAEDGWTGEVGFVGKEMLTKYMPDLSSSFTLTCGPPPMNRSVLNYLKELGMKEENYFKF